MIEGRCEFFDAIDGVLGDIAIAILWRGDALPELDQQVAVVTVAYHEHHLGDGSHHHRRVGERELLRGEESRGHKGVKVDTRPWRSG